SYFSGTELGMTHGPAEGLERELLLPFSDSLLPGALEGYSLPKGDGSLRNRADLRRAMTLLKEAGWSVQEGVLRNAAGEAFAFDILLPQGAAEKQAFSEIFAQGLKRLGISARIEVVDNAQYFSRLQNYQFDMTDF